MHEEGPRLFNADTRRIAVAGGSAGGYLTLMSGFCVKPRPAVLVSFWGYGDIAGDWYIKPSTFYRKQPLVSKEDAWKGVSGPAVTDRKRADRGARPLLSLLPPARTVDDQRLGHRSAHSGSRRSRRTAPSAMSPRTIRRPS